MERAKYSELIVCPLAHFSLLKRKGVYIDANFYLENKGRRDCIIPACPYYMRFGWNVQIYCSSKEGGRHRANLNLQKKRRKHQKQREFLEIARSDAMRKIETY